MRIVAVIALLLVVTVPLFGGNAVSTSETSKGRLELTLKTMPVPDQPHAYRLDAVLKNLTTGEIIAAPRVTFQAGTPAEITSEAGGGGMKLIVASSRQKSQATVDCEYSVRGEVIFAPRISLLLD